MLTGGNGATLAAVKLGQKALAAKLPGYIQLAGGTNYYTVSKLKSLGLLSLDKTPNAVARNGASSQARQEEPFRIAGIAYGSYARTLLAPILEQLEQSSQQFPLSTSAEHDFVPFHSSRSEQSFDRQQFQIQLEDSDLLWQAVQTAHTLVSQIKQPMTAFAPSG